MNLIRTTKWIKSVKAEFVFLVISFFFGITFLIITPPFQVPDEINHFYRSYQISNGILFTEPKDNRLGGYVPLSFNELTKPFFGLRWNRNIKTNFRTIGEQFSIPLNEDQKIFVDFPNSALYSPVSYIPQAFSIFILRSLNFSPLIIFYGSRLFTLLIWILCIFLAIRITPIFKWLFTLLALLPMSIFMNMSLSGDVVTNISAFLFIAYILKVAYQEKDFEPRSYLIIIILALLLATAKIVYTPLILLFALIPLKKFQNLKSFSIYFTILLLIGFGTSLLMSKLINQLYIPYNEYNPAYRDGIDLVSCASIQGQTNYILAHGTYIFEVIIHSIYQSFNMYYEGYIGTFGWLDTKLPLWVIHISYLTILLVALFENNKKPGLNYFQKIVIFCSLLASTGLILISQHLGWDCVGGELIANLQGRYFIPVFPLFFILFNLSKNNRPINLRIPVVLFSILLLTYSSWTLYSRYYIQPIFEHTEILCDAEEITADNLYKTSVSTIYFENGNTQNAKKSRSGSHSAQLYPGNEYAFTYRFFDGGIGDEINIKVWRYGKSGTIVLSGASGKAFYLTSSDISETDEKGWDKLEYQYMLQSNMKGKEIGIFLYNNTIDTCYFDDLSISINKLTN